MMEILENLGGDWERDCKVKKGKFQEMDEIWEGSWVGWMDGWMDGGFGVLISFIVKLDFGILIYIRIAIYFMQGKLWIALYYKLVKFNNG